MSRNLKLMDLWLADNDLNRYGDPKGTMYTGGTSQMPGDTGVSRDRYEYVKRRYSNEPWITRAEFTRIGLRPPPISVPSVPSKVHFAPPIRLKPPISAPSVPSKPALPVDVNDVEPAVVDQVVNFLSAGGGVRNWSWVECEDAMSECSRKVLGKLSNMQEGRPVFDDDEDEEGVRSWRECEEAMRGCSIKMVGKLSSIREGRPIFN